MCTKHVKCSAHINEQRVQKCTDTRALDAALIGLIDLRVPGLKVVAIIGLLAGNLR